MVRLLLNISKVVCHDVKENPAPKTTIAKYLNISIGTVKQNYKTLDKVNQ